MKNIEEELKNYTEPEEIVKHTFNKAIPYLEIAFSFVLFIKKVSTL